MIDVLLTIIEITIIPGILFLFFFAFFLEWFDRKIVAKIQNRIGPKITGPHGILQPLADFIKLLGKEDITPRCADRIGFNVVPYLSVFVAFLTLFMIPMVSVAGVLSFPGDIIVLIFLFIVFSIISIFAGYFGEDPLSVVGASRAGLQFVAYEVPLIVAVMGPIILSGSISITDIVLAQSSIPFIVYCPIGFLVFLIAGMAKLEKPPFDVPEAESEIVGGWLVEYSGKKLAMFRLAHDLKLIIIAGVAVTLFLGGPLGPAIPGFEPIFYFIYFVLKVLFFVFIVSVIRAVFPRYRIDQLLRMFWRLMLVLAFIQLLVVFAYLHWAEIASYFEVIVG